MGNSSTNNFELNILGLGAFPIELQQVLNGNIKNEIIPQKPFLHGIIESIM